MKNPAPADLQRWSEELARNPASLAFLPLARAYRRIGRRDHAQRLTLRGLDAHPGNVEAHALLALLYLEEGDRAKAADEWSIVLRLKPGNFEALRGMGFRYLEQNDTSKARQHLERAALIRPDDTAVQEALRLLRQREAVAPPPPPPPPPPVAPAAPEPAEAPVMELETDAIVEPEAEAVPIEDLAEPVVEAPWTPFDGQPAEPAAARQEPAPAPVAPPPPAPTRPAAAAPAPSMADDPAHLFDDLLASPYVRGVLLLDARGLVLAGGLAGAGSADDTGAILGSAVDEAVRTVEFLGLGVMKGLLMECDAAVLHVRPIADQGIAVLAVAPDSPTGWILRTASNLAGRAARYLEVPA